MKRNVLTSQELLPPYDDFAAWMIRSNKRHQAHIDRAGSLGFDEDAFERKVEEAKQDERQRKKLRTALRSLIRRLKQYERELSPGKPR
jgi:hypothetical protein